MTLPSDVKTVYEDVCENSTETRCKTDYKEKPDKLCVKIPKEKCETKYDVEYVTEYDEKCSESKEKRCKTVHEQKCRKKTITVPERSCVTIEEEKCDGGDGYGDDDDDDGYKWNDVTQKTDSYGSTTPKTTTTERYSPDDDDSFGQWSGLGNIPSNIGSEFFHQFKAEYEGNSKPLKESRGAPEVEFGKKQGEPVKNDEENRIDCVTEYRRECREPDIDFYFFFPGKCEDVPVTVCQGDQDDDDLQAKSSTKVSKYNNRMRRKRQKMKMMLHRRTGVGGGYERRLDILGTVGNLLNLGGGNNNNNQNSYKHADFSGGYRPRKKKKPKRCRYEPKVECKTEYKKVKQEQCRQIPRQKCRSFPKRTCRKVPKTVPKRKEKKSCQTVYVDDCYTDYKRVPEEVCKEFPKRTCKKIPRKVRKKVPFQSCDVDAETVCRKVPLGRPVQYPRVRKTILCHMG